MFNVKWGVFASIAAFVLAFITSLLLGQTSLVIALVRALIFAGVFFALAAGAWMLINTYIPELLTGKEDTGPNAAHDVFGSASAAAAASAGSRINITVDDDSGSSVTAALPEEGDGPPKIDDVGNFNDLVSGNFNPLENSPSGAPAAQDAPKDDGNAGEALDQNTESSYTMEAEEFTPAPEDNAGSEPAGFSVDFGAFVADSGGIGELDSYMDSFSMFSDDDSSPAEAAPVPERRASGNKPAELKGDFDAKEIAAGIRTVLEKDKR